MAATTSGGGSKTATIIIAVVIGGFVLIAVIGILAAIAIPNLLTAMARSQQKRTMADMRSIATAVEAYATDHNQYPNADDVDGLAPMLTPTYIRQLPAMDGWSHEYRYEAWSREKDFDTYAVGSAGKDGIWEHESLQEYSEGTPQRFDCDIVFSNGTFVQYPGTQR